MLRNVAVALGNWGSPEAVPVLAAALADEEPLVRGHAAWVLRRIGTEAARQALRGREEVGDDVWVREEIGAALGQTAEGVTAIPLLAARLEQAGVDAPVLKGLAGMIQGRVEPERWTAALTAPTTVKRADRARAA